MNDIRKELEERRSAKKPLLFDGGMGTWFASLPGHAGEIFCGPAAGKISTQIYRVLTFTIWTQFPVHLFITPDYTVFQKAGRKKTELR